MPRTRASCCCNPNNPTGSVYDRATMEAFLGWRSGAGIFLIVDEVYQRVRLRWATAYQHSGYRAGHRM